MCAICGCSGEAPHHLHDHHSHDDHDHPHHHDHDHLSDARTVLLEQDILAKNDGIAAATRARLTAMDIVALNFVSAPGSGKTTLLEQTVRYFAQRTEVSAIEGDQETERDAERLREAGCPVVQINTGSGCHLNAQMTASAIERLNPREHSLLLIENVGNLVCPALFDLGEFAKVVVMSVTEGDDKPLKYPHIFRASDVMVVNKIDLLPHVPFSVERCLSNARRVNPNLRVFEVSALRRDGLASWFDWVHSVSPTLAGKLEAAL